MFRIFKNKQDKILRAYYHHGHFLAAVITDSTAPGWHGVELWFTHRECDPVKNELDRTPILVSTRNALSEDEKAELYRDPEQFMKQLLVDLIKSQAP